MCNLAINITHNRFINLGIIFIINGIKIPIKVLNLRPSFRYFKYDILGISIAPKRLKC